MKRIAAALIVINVVLIALFFSPLRPAYAQPSSESVPAVLRAHALEIVDEQGRVRAQIILTAAQTVDGVSYPAGTLLRLNDPDGRPNVKIGSDGRGAGAALSGADAGKGAWYGIQLLSQDGQSIIKVVDRAGRETVLRP
ncbi:MAG TPA: hypothetical protein VMQ10_07860 [Spirochaetia bacterium]|nr:hypothetical protein [Spirochaetia bacterium]